MIKETSPYTSQGLISEQIGSEDGFVTCIEAWDSSIYIGLSNGEILHYFRDSSSAISYILASRQKAHSKKSRAVFKILLLPSVSRAIVLANSTSSVFTLPEFTPTSGLGSLRDVNDLCIDVDDRSLVTIPSKQLSSTTHVGWGSEVQVTVFTKTAIRIVRVQEKALKLIRSVDYPQVSVGVQRSSYALVANATSYDLIDTLNIRKIPLFPILSGSETAEESRMDVTAPETVAEAEASEELTTKKSTEGSEVDVLAADETALTGQKTKTESETVESLNQDESSAQDDISKPAKTFEPAESSDTVEITKLVKTKPETEPENEPVEALKPADVSKPAEGSTPDEPPKPAEGSAPDKTPKQTETSKRTNPSHHPNRYPIKPIIIPVATDEFLVTSGTTIDEPAMGLVVNVDGDISRGTIAWPKYPSSVAVDYPYVASVIDNDVQFYSLHDQGLVQTLHYTDPPKLFSVLAIISQPYAPLADKIRLIPLKETGDEEETQRIQQETTIAEKLSIISSSLFVFSKQKGVECLLSSPRIIYLEKLIEQEKIDQVTDEMDSLDISTERAVVELEYLKLLVGLGYLLHRDYVSASEAWLEGSLDPRIVVSIYDISVIRGDIWIFHGAKSMIERLYERDTAKSTTSTQDISFNTFLKTLLGEWMKRRDLESVNDKHFLFESLELCYLKLLLNDSHTSRRELYKLLDHHIVESYEDSAAMLKQFNRYVALAHMYEKNSKPGLVCEVWKNLITGKWKEQRKGEYRNGEINLAAYLISCTDEEVVWEYGIWLAENYPTAGLSVFLNEKAKVKFEEKRVLTAFRGFESHEAWREYLKVIVGQRNNTEFSGELILFEIEDLLELIKKQGQDAKNEIANSYEVYRQLPLPKRDYISFLTSYDKRDLGAEVTSRRVEALRLLRINEQNYDVDKVEALVDQEPDLLVMERCILYSRKQLHEECVKLLCKTISDYDTAISYCIYGSLGTGVDGDEQATTASELASEVQRQLFQIVFEQFLQIPDDADKIVCTKRLLEGWGNKLDLRVVLNTTPSSWPVEVLSGYLIHSLRHITNGKNQSIMSRSLSRSENMTATKQLVQLKAASLNAANIRSRTTSVTNEPSS